MKSNDFGYTLTSFLTLILFSFFALCSLFIVLIGAKDYQVVVEQSEQNNEIRASLTYVANKIRQNDEAGFVQVFNQDGTQILSLTQDIDGQLYDTYIYFYNGNLNEQFVKHTAKIDLNEGSVITAVERFDISMENSAVILQVQNSNREKPLVLKIQLQTK